MTGREKCVPGVCSGLRMGEVVKFGCGSKQMKPETTMTTRLKQEGTETDPRENDVIRS